MFQSVPVTIDAVLNSGEHQRFKGTSRFRSVNGVDGATPAQRPWYIEPAKRVPVTSFGEERSRLPPKTALLFLFGEQSLDHGDHAASHRRAQLTEIPGKRLSLRGARERPDTRF